MDSTFDFTECDGGQIAEPLKTSDTDSCPSATSKSRAEVVSPVYRYDKSLGVFDDVSRPSPAEAGYHDVMRTSRSGLSSGTST